MDFCGARCCGPFLIGGTSDHSDSTSCCYVGETARVVGAGTVKGNTQSGASFCAATAEDAVVAAIHCSFGIAHDVAIPLTCDGMDVGVSLA